MIKMRIWAKEGWRNLSNMRSFSPTTFHGRYEILLRRSVEGVIELCNDNGKELRLLQSELSYHQDKKSWSPSGFLSLILSNLHEEASARRTPSTTPATATTTTISTTPPTPSTTATIPVGPLHITSEFCTNIPAECRRCTR